jgi:hypothetical protein
VPTGANGLSGPAGNPAAAGAPYTVLAQGFAAKGADASIADTRVWFFPELRVNPAVRMRGEYWVTGGHLRGLYDGAGAGFATVAANNWTNSQGYNGWSIQVDGSPGNSVAPSGMTSGMWEKFWVTAQTPWCIFVVGRRPFPFGLAWSALHERDADVDTWMMVVPYGPLTFMFAQGLRTSGDFFVENSSNVLGGTAVTVAAGTDKNRLRPWDGAGIVVYRNGPIEWGTMPRPVIYWDQHFLGTVPAGFAGRDDHNTAPLQALFLNATHVNDPATPIYGDIGFAIWVTYFKYFNGRFFFNAEYDFEVADIPRKGGRPVSMWADAWEIEMGAMCGPAKLSVANFYHSGDDRRGGWLNVSNALGGGGYAGSGIPAGTYVYDKFTRFLLFGGGGEAIKPYVYLMGIYGAGNNSYDARGIPTYLDFLAWAARLDYAVAANLNVSGSFIYANRGSNTGTFVGAYRGGIANAGVRTHPGLNAAGAQIAPIPNVPNNNLGWEVNIAANWKLLEGLTFNALFAYWQPGEWFKWAYTDFSSAATANINGIDYPVNPNRGIDPIIGFQSSVVVDF